MVKTKIIECLQFRSYIIQNETGCKGYEMVFYNKIA